MGVEMALVLIIGLQALAIGGLLAARNRLRTDLEFERFRADLAEAEQQEWIRARLTRERSRDAARGELAKVYSILGRERRTPECLD